MHCFIANGSNKMMVADTSDSTQFTTVCITKISGSDNEEDSDSEEEEGSETIPEDFSIGNWVVVNYNGEEFSGEITSCGSEIEVSVMHKSGNKFWKWPKTIDKIFYERKDVVRKINPPKVAGHRGQWVFED